MTFEKRSLRPGDAPAWSALLNTVTTADGEGRYWSEADLLKLFDDSNLDFARGSIGYFDGQDMVASGLLLLMESADPVHAMRHMGGVHPAWRGRGVGSDLLDWAQTQAVVVHERVFPGRPLRLGSGCVTTDTAGRTLHEARGFSLVRRFHAMVCDLASPVAPAGLSPGLRAEAFTLDRSEDGRLVRNEAFRDHWDSEDATQESWARRARSFLPEFSYLAYEGDEPLGLLVCQEHEARTAATGRRELYVAIVGTRAIGRKRGIATSLLSRALAAARAAGFDQAALNVDADSLTGAVGVYENIGFKVAASRAVYQKQLITA